MWLFDANTWQEVFHTLSLNKKRTLTTASGVFWGLFLLTILLSLGEGMNNRFSMTFSGVGNGGNVLLFSANETTIPYDGYGKGRYLSFNLNDVSALKAKIPDLKEIYYYVRHPQSYRTKIYNGEKSEDISAYLAAKPGYFENESVVEVVEGRLLNAQDEILYRRVCLLGDELADKLFPEESAIGHTVKIENMIYTVVGIIKPINDNFSIFTNVKEDVFIPRSIMHKLFTDPEKIDMIIVYWKPGGATGEALQRDITTFLQKRHHVSPEDKSAIESFDASSIVRASNLMVFGLEFFVWVVGIGTLLAGIIGVSNIMLVSLSERTREIGIRRAIGAPRRAIFSQIILESFTITFLAGVLGVSLGVGLMLLINDIIGENADMFYKTLISPGITVVIILVISLAGVLSGLLPAYRALHIKTIQALQEE